jgi:hypothetical protein
VNQGELAGKAGGLFGFRPDGLLPGVGNKRIISGWWAVAAAGTRRAADKKGGRECTAFLNLPGVAVNNRPAGTSSAAASVPLLSGHSPVLGSTSPSR